MALDQRRNEAYARALRRVITPQSVVLDLGAGTGVLGMIAARLGAARVYLVEPEDVITVAEELVHANGLAGRVQCIQGRIEDVALPEQVDVIVSVLTGNFMLAEDLLPTLFYARDHYLRPGGVLVPSGATMEAVPVQAEELHTTYVARWSAPQVGVDLSSVRTYAANTVIFENDLVRLATPLAEPQRLQRLDFRHDDYGAVHIAADYAVTQSGVCHGWAGWSTIQLGDDWLSTSPFAPALHWSPAFLPLDPVMSFAAGDQVSLALDRVPGGDWTWSTSVQGDTRRHSTLFADPLSPAMLARASLDYMPTLNAEASLLSEALRLCDGTRNVRDIAERLSADFPGRFASIQDAVSFTQHLVRRHES